MRLAYRGRDDLVRSTQIEFSRPPGSHVRATRREFLIELQRGAVAEMFIEIGARTEATPSPERFRRSAAALVGEHAEAPAAQGASLEHSGRLFNQWIDKSRSDLALLTTPLPTGPYPYAGIPWFATQFGRDAIITALQTLWLESAACRAACCAFWPRPRPRTTSAFRDSQPGKIMHETRRGEMAALREVPFGRYYGGVDTTPLFVMLAGAYERRTGDRALIDEIWPHLLAATAWIERRLERSPTGFLDYARGREDRSGQPGLERQPGLDLPCRRQLSRRARSRSSRCRATPMRHSRRWRSWPPRAATRDEAAAWQRARRATARRRSKSTSGFRSLSFYAIALDGDGRALQRSRFERRASAVLRRAVAGARAKSVAAQLLSSGFCSGWGIRTLAAGQARYNPMSYHNGSVWPHDTVDLRSGHCALCGQRAAW